MRPDGGWHAPGSRHGRIGLGGLWLCRRRTPQRNDSAGRPRGEVETRAPANRICVGSIPTAGAPKQPNVAERTRRGNTRCCSLDAVYSTANAGAGRPRLGWRVRLLLHCPQPCRERPRPLRGAMPAGGPPGRPNESQSPGIRARTSISWVADFWALWRGGCRPLAYPCGRGLALCQGQDLDPYESLLRP